MNNSYETKKQLIEDYSNYLKSLPNLKSLAIHSIKISLKIKHSFLDQVDKINIFEKLGKMTNEYMKKDSIRNAEKYNKIINKGIISKFQICLN